MFAPRKSLQHLLSLPPNIVAHFAELEQRPAPEWFATCDPPPQKLGSGGGTAHLLIESWRQTGGTQSFAAWLRSSRKLMIHGGGQSRRQPAYAPAGKLLTPMPIWRWAVGQHLTQTLLDLQLPGYRRLLAHAPESLVAMVTSGDVLLRFADRLPPFPEADILCMGLWVKPEEAQHFGVFFCPKRNPGELRFFLQKPSPETIRKLAAEYLFLVDTGIWMFSERAVRVLLKKCGCAGVFRDGAASAAATPYELYSEFGLGLGVQPTVPDRDFGTLTSAVVPLPGGEFYHFGTSRDLILSNSRLQNVVLDQRQFTATSYKPHPDMFTQNARVECPLGPENHTLWMENSHLATGWRLASEHVLTGIPENDWALPLERGVCLDVVPIGPSAYCVRTYGLDDAFRGPLGAAATNWCGRPAAEWFARRGLALDAAGLTPDTDVQAAKLFPVLPRAQLTGEFVTWLFAAAPAASPKFRALWLRARRLSADDLGREANLKRLYAQRGRFLYAALPALAQHHERSVFYKQDLSEAAQLYAAAALPLPAALPAPTDIMKRVHDHMFRAAVCRRRGETNWERHEQRAFALLRDEIVATVLDTPARPVSHVLEDQIVWGRSPVRFDLAGGWTDTPPYCLLNGGKVVNAGVDLNGQPPIQVFAKLSEKPEIVLRSIDLGVEVRVRDLAQLTDYAQVGSGFSVAKAALAIAGFEPRFHGGRQFRSLEEHLRAFGGGIELSLLAAVPKGSGLGTSSILAATVLGTLSDLCGLGWSTQDLITRTLVLEQLLTTGGGWQDQAGGLLRSLKLVETGPGLSQKAVVKWLPEQLCAPPYANSVMLLYYTGITRVAKGILQEIVRGMFLNAGSHLAILDELGRHADDTYDVLQQADWPGLCRAIARSWELNQRLDAGTNPPAVQEFLDRIGDWLAAGKLLGAGGGGYMLMLAKDAEAARRIREELTQRPPNAKARFVDFSLSPTGLQVTRS